MVNRLFPSTPLENSCKKPELLKKIHVILFTGLVSSLNENSFLLAMLLLRFSNFAWITARDFETILCACEGQLPAKCRLLSRNLVPRVSLLCLPWSLENRPWLRLVT